MLLEGTKVGRYEIRSLLGKGGMGEVYLADDLRLRRPVALKLLRSNLTANQDRLRRFEREAYTASSLNHPNILTIHEIGREGENQFIVTEFVDGESLRTRLDRELPKLSELLEIGIQVSAALSAAHEAGIVHRDIKPDNIMLRRDGLVKVVDFGLAKLSEQQQEEATSDHVSETTPGTVLGTARYMSPEQARGLAVDTRTDIWSLGVVLYQMVTGRLPFSGPTMSDVIAEVLKTDPPALSTHVQHVPDDLERIVMKALCKNRDERYQEVKELSQDLKALKQRMEFEAELERSGGGMQVSGVGTRTSEGRQRVTHQGGDATFDTQVGKSTVGPPSSAGIFKGRGRTLPLALALLIVAVAVGGWWFYSSKSGPRSSGETAGGAVEIVPFTSFPGDEVVPSFSADGTRIAFSWNGEARDNVDIYVKPIGSDDLQRLTTDPAPDLEPRWSPDGRQIAFLRQTAVDYGLYLMSSNGGTEREITKLALLPPMRFDIAQVSWSPDGEWLAVSDKLAPDEPFSIFIVARDSGAKRRLTSPAGGNSGDLTPAVSPDGKQIAYKHFESGGVSEIYVSPVAGGEARRLTFSEAVQSSPAWTPDGRDILYLSESGGNIGIWRVPAAGGTPVRVEAAGQAVSSFAISPQGNYLAWTQSMYDSNVWETELSGGMPPAARKESARLLISSTKGDVSSQFSPDGKRIVFASTRSGRAGIWLAESTGQRPMQLVQFDRGSSGSPRWSTDGKWIVFDGRVEGNADVYLISSEGGEPQRLTTEAAEDIVPSFSRDGQSIYFCSNRGGSRQIWKMPASGGQAVQITTRGGFDNVESPDGQFLYFARERGEPGISRVPVAGGQATPVLDHHGAGLSRQWAVVEDGIYFMSSEVLERPLIEFFRFSTGKVSLVMTLDRRLPDTFSGLAISPDGRRLVWTQLDQMSSDITLIRNFR